MNVKEAVARAREYVLDLFSEDGISNLALEEIEFDEGSGEWRITLGFSRPWEHPLGGSLMTHQPRRSYKLVRIADQSGAVLSVKNREMVAS